jgi:hypothetical protein
LNELQRQLTLDAWRRANDATRASLARAIVAESKGTLAVVRTAGDDAVPVFHHAPLQILFHLVPGGTSRLGFSAKEHDAVYQQYRGWWEADTDDAICEDKNQLPAPFEVTLPAFLLAGRPLDGDQLERLARDDAPDPGAKPSEGRRTWTYADVVKMPADKYVRYLNEVGNGTLSESDFDRLGEQLRSRGLRLPTHDEWEVAARAGGSTPFPTSTMIPKTPNTGVNRFGFVDMGAWPEVVAGMCSYTSPPTRALRGGAAMCYPGQDCGEWTLMLCAIRLGASAFTGMLHLRPALEIA